MVTTICYYIYYDLVADEADKRAIRDCGSVYNQHIVDHNYTLIGHTGRRTLWGAFVRSFWNDDPARGGKSAGLNSSELLCYLKVAPLRLRATRSSWMLLRS